MGTRAEKVETTPYYTRTRSTVDQITQGRSTWPCDDKQYAPTADTDTIPSLSSLLTALALVLFLRGFIKYGVLPLLCTVLRLIRSGRSIISN